MEETWTCCAKVWEDEEDMVDAQELRLVNGDDDRVRGRLTICRGVVGVYIWSTRDNIVDERQTLGGGGKDKIPDRGAAKIRWSRVTKGKVQAHLP